jgi:hypothetical protein
VFAADAFEQARRDADVGPTLLDCPVEHVARTGTCIDPSAGARVDIRVCGHHHQPADPRQPGDDFLRHSVREIVLVGIAAQIAERIHRN